MYKFLNGERTFKRGDVVYFFSGSNAITFGVINQYAGLGVYYINLYCKKDCRQINGISYNDLDFSKEYRLPKKWTWNMELLKQPETLFSYSDDYEEVIEYLKQVRICDPVQILDAIKKGYLVKRSDVFPGYIRTDVSKNSYKLTKEFYNYSEFPNEISLHESLIFKTYEDAENYKKGKEEEARKRRELFATMTEDEINLYEIREHLQKIGLDTLSIAKCMFIIHQMRFPFPLADLEIRVTGDEIQYMNEYKKWQCLIKLPEKSLGEKEHDEKYYVTVFREGDMDMEPLVRCYTNKEPEYWFLLYSDVKKYVLFIGNRHWCIENGLDEPKNYVVGIKEDGNGGITPVMVEHYEISNGGFDIVEGKLSNFDISIDKDHSLCNFFIHQYVRQTNRTEDEIREFYKKNVAKITGRFSDLFADKIERLPIEC